jgi:hypothetical protein
VLCAAVKGIYSLLSEFQPASAFPAADLTVALALFLEYAVDSDAQLSPTPTDAGVHEELRLAYD